MELRQLRYFVRIVELDSMRRTALDMTMDMVPSALSQQISRMEFELSIRLRTSCGVTLRKTVQALFH